MRNPKFEENTSIFRVVHVDTKIKIKENYITEDILFNKIKKYVEKSNKYETSLKTTYIEEDTKILFQILKNITANFQDEKDFNKSLSLTYKNLDPLIKIKSKVINQDDLAKEIESYVRTTNEYADKENNLFNESEVLRSIDEFIRKKYRRAEFLKKSNFEDNIAYLFEKFRNRGIYDPYTKRSIYNKNKYHQDKNDLQDPIERIPDPRWQKPDNEPSNEKLDKIIEKCILIETKHTKKITINSKDTKEKEEQKVKVRKDLQELLRKYIDGVIDNLAKINNELETLQTNAGYKELISFDISSLSRIINPIKINIREAIDKEFNTKNYIKLIEEILNNPNVEPSPEVKIYLDPKTDKSDSKKAWRKAYDNGELPDEWKRNKVHKLIASKNFRTTFKQCKLEKDELIYLNDKEIAKKIREAVKKKKESHTKMEINLLVNYFQRKINFKIKEIGECNTQAQNAPLHTNNISRKDANFNSTLNTTVNTFNEMIYNGKTIQINNEVKEELKSYARLGIRYYSTYEILTSLSSKFFDNDDALAKICFNKFKEECKNNKLEI